LHAPVNVCIIVTGSYPFKIRTKADHLVLGEMTCFMTGLAAEDAEVLVATQMCFNDQLAVGIPWLILTVWWKRNS